MSVAACRLEKPKNLQGNPAKKKSLANAVGFLSMKLRKKPIAAPSSKKPKELKMKRLPVLLVLPVLLILLLVWYRLSLLPVTAGSTEQKVFVIPKGQSTNEILARLENESLIKSTLALKIYLKLSNENGSLQAGSFRLSSSQAAPAIIEELKHGTLDTWITIPEGWRSEQIVEELIKQGLLQNASASKFYQQFRQFEGQLFPDTYLFAKDSNPDQIITRLTNNFSQKTADLNPPAADLILASLVEREAKHEADRPKIAAVLKNRLKIGMALQVDATLQYAKASPQDWWPKISALDKAIKSPFNTYKYPGLPPGPIANPGISSIKAVLSPQKINYLYYLSEPDGTTHYANTLEEHNGNIRKYLY